MINRREFLVASAATGLALLSPVLRNRVEAADAKRLKITGIDWDQVLVPYQDFNRQALFRYHGLELQLRTRSRARH